MPTVKYNTSKDLLLAYLKSVNDANDFIQNLIKELEKQGMPEDMILMKVRKAYNRWFSLKGGLRI